LNAPIINLFALLLVFFLVLAFGPTPQIAGKAILGDRSVLPYAWLETLIPPLAISGVPVRMMVMVMLSAAILAGFGFSLLLSGSAGRQRVAVAMASLLAIEYWPTPLPNLSVPVPKYVDIVRDLPGRDGVIDTVAAPSVAMFYQTLHQKPLAFGYLAREPEERRFSGSAARDAALAGAIRPPLAGLSPPLCGEHRSAPARVGRRANAVADGEVAVIDLATDGRSSPPRGP
jgi:hypothetical protein